MSTKSILTAAKKSFYQMQNIAPDSKNMALQRFAELIEDEKDFLITANIKDLKLQKGKIKESLYSRLKLDEPKIKSLTQGILDIAGFDEPCGKLLEQIELDTGLILDKVSVSIGVIGVIFESRPDVIPQILALILKSGNVAVLKGGSEASYTNKAFMKLVSQLNTQFNFLPKAWAQLIVDRKAVHEMLKFPKLVDLVIPRGSNQLVQSIQNNTKIPVLGHADGICHVYVEKSADFKMAEEIILDSKAQYPSACNSMETLLIDKAISKTFLPQILEKLKQHHVKAILKPKNWSHEYGDLTCAVKIVNDTTDAIEHINTYSSHHTDTIVTKNQNLAEEFVKNVDSASVLVNASTRFADGFRYGMGAEVGVSTNRTHARGPVGIEGLLTYKYIVRGEGHLVATYSGDHPRPFLHEKLK